MQKALEWVKNNKKIILAVTLIIILLCVLYFINKGEKSPTAATTTDEKSATEIKLISVLSNMEGVGNTDVMINESDGKITGVVVVCDGAQNIMTRSNILNAVATALNIDKKYIAVYSMNN